MNNNILVPDYSLPQPAYQPLFLHDSSVLFRYFCSIGISPYLYQEAFNQLIISKGILTQSIINYLRYLTSLAGFPSAPLGEFDDQLNFNAYECTFSVGTLQTHHGRESTR